MTRRFALTAILLFMSMLGIAYESPIRDDSPDSYSVQKGDTLWDISNMFLKSPWLWPEIWHANPQIHNPHLIFPGDLVSLVYVNGRPRLTVSNRGNAGRTIKLSPKVRKLPAEAAIPAIPLSSIDAYLNHSRIFNMPAELDRAPYILASRDGRSAYSQGDKVYGRGNFIGQEGVYKVYRKTKDLTDPKTGEYLGAIGEEVSTLDLKKVSGDVATLVLRNTRREVRPGDRLIKEDPFSLETTFFPGAPDIPTDAVILTTLGDQQRAARFDTVVINRGDRFGLKQGDILAIYKTMQVKDSLTNEMVTLPPERVGLVMVYRPFAQTSFAIVLSASEDVEAGDLLKSP